MRKILFAFILINFSSLSFSQANDTKFSFNIELGLPSTIANEPFSDIMQGLANCSMYGQYKFPFEFSIGAGLRYSLFTVNQFSINEDIGGAKHIATGFLKFGWEKFHSDRFGTDLSVKVGYSNSYYLTSANKTSPDFPVMVQSNFVEPTLGLILTVDDWNSYRFHVGYAFQGYGFKPQLIGLQSNTGYNPSSFNKLTQYLVVGFGYTYYFSDKKKTE